VHPGHHRPSSHGASEVAHQIGGVASDLIETDDSLSDGRVLFSGHA
jgi:hypothetical protein